MCSGNVSAQAPHNIMHVMHTKCREMMHVSSHQNSQMSPQLYAESSLAPKIHVPSLLLHVCLQHPGFDFSGAKFSGEAPNPRTFMGGMSQQ